MSDTARNINEDPSNEKLCDWISMMPEDVLVGILSRLKLKEAASTSVLARKWLSLWTHTTGILNFDTVKPMGGSHLQSAAEIALERTKFITWVNQVLHQHKGPHIEELRICCNLDETSTCEVDRWIMFSIEKSVQRLELDLSKLSNTYHVQPYNFPSVEKFNLNSHTCFSCLRSLRLNHVNVTDDILNYVLTHSSFLECLCVTNALDLKTVVISSPVLKYLEICDCLDLNHMEVSAINLLSIKYVGACLAVFLKDVPRLTELYTGGHYTEYLIYDTPHHLNNLSQLETITFCFREQTTPRYPNPPHFQLDNVKYLEVILKPSGEFSLLHYTWLIARFPYLTTFRMQLDTRKPRSEYPPSFETDLLDIMERGYPKYPHASLKVVELINFATYPAEFSLARRLIKNSLSLERMIIKLKEDIKNIDIAICRVGILRPLLRQGAELVILPSH